MKYEDYHYKPDKLSTKRSPEEEKVASFAVICAVIAAAIMMFFAFIDGASEREHQAPAASKANVR